MDNESEKPLPGAHTPGPWKARRDDYQPNTWAIGPSVGETVCRLTGAAASRADAEANAHLIAAAPTLLSIARRWAAIDGGSWHVERHAREKDELLADTRAAIAKATAAGRSA